jgi:hypothetical protein
MSNYSTQSEMNKVAYVASAIAPGPVQMIMGIVQLAQIILGWFSLTPEIFLRFSFGEKYLSPLRILLAWETLKSFVFGYNLLGALLGFTSPVALFLSFSNLNFSTLFADGMHSFYFQCFVYGFWIRVALHLLVIYKRNLDGKEWHSGSFGISVLEYLPWGLWTWLISFIPVRSLRKAFEVDDWKLYCVLEPTLCYIAAQSLRPLDGLLGTWLLISSVALAIKNNIHYFEMRGRYLDMMDSQIEGMYMQAAFGGANKRETAGFSVIPVPMRFAPAGEMNIEATVQQTLGQKSEA